MIFARYASAEKNSGDVTIRRVDLAEIALRVEELLRRAIDQRLGRLVGDEPLRELEGNVMRGGRMPREQVERAFAFFESLPAGNFVPSSTFVAGVVHLRPEDELPARLRPIDRPARQDPRELDDVLLRVAAVDAERVELHQLARVVLVEPRALTLRRPRRRRLAADCTCPGFTCPGRTCPGRTCPGRTIG